MNDVACDDYRSSIKEEIFSCIELGKQTYGDILSMPVKRMRDYLKWKYKLEEEKRKHMEENLEQ